MKKEKDFENYSGKEAKKRMDATLRGAFAGSPTPLKAIPKRNGESRNAKPKSKKKPAK